MEHWTDTETLSIRAIKKYIERHYNKHGPDPNLFRKDGLEQAGPLVGLILLNVVRLWPLVKGATLPMNTCEHFMLRLDTLRYLVKWGTEFQSNSIYFTRFRMQGILDAGESKKDPVMNVEQGCHIVNVDWM